MSSPFLVSFPMRITNTTQYHDATNTGFYLHFHDISHEIHQNGSVPRCYKWHALSQFCFMVFSMQFTKTAQYHDATNSAHCLFFSWDFPLISQKRLGTKTQSITRVISCFSRYFPWKSPKRLGTMMLQKTGFIFIFHVISHEIHQNGSVPRCHK